VIDFRYHVVSLISVFLALAVGIALGAGPLEETIGDSLTGQVEVLREDRDALRAELADARASLDRQSEYLRTAAPQLVAGTLTGRRVAIVGLGPVPEEQRAGVEEQLVAAGATVSADVQVTDLWADPSLDGVREALAGNLATYLDPAPAEGAGVDARLADALAQGLTGADPAAPDRLAEPAGLVLQLLASGENELITLAGPVESPADAVVLLTAETPPPASEPAPEETEERLASHLAVVTAAEAHSEGAVLADGAASPGELVSAVLADAELAARVSTVSAEAVAGLVSVPLALNAQIGGTVGHYGFGDGLVPVPEPVALAQPDRTATADATGAADVAPEG
jgi:hypothetical protein